MRLANEYEVVFRLRDGKEETVRLWAWNAIDVPVQGIYELQQRLSEAAIEGVSLVRLGPPTEACATVALQVALDRLVAVAKEEVKKK